MSEKTSNKQSGKLGSDPNFRWLMSGAVISMLGDQFSLIAFPWLVLKMTGDSLVLGTVLAVISVPRALFILLGGALVDRYSPKRVMVLTKYVNMLLLGLLAALVLSNTVALWMVYGLAAGIGLATAFSIPASTAMLPHVVQRTHLQAANSMMMGIRQFSAFAGPLLAGLLIALFGDGTSGVVMDAKGLGMAFSFDALSFALSAWTLSRVNTLTQAAPARSGSGASALQAVAEGVRYCWNDRSLRTCFLYWAAVALLVGGPVQVAMPILANQLPHGAAAFGALSGAYGAGTLAGMIVSGIKPNLRFGNLGMTILLLDGLIGLLLIPLGHINATWQGVLLLSGIGLFGGFLQANVFTWLQGYTAPAMLGRVMSILMFIFMGVAPIAAAITGWIMRTIAPAQFFMGSGLLLVSIVAIAFATSHMRFISDLKPLPTAGH